MPDSQIRVRMEVLRYAARRHVVGVGFNYLVRASLGLPFRDTQCGLKGFDRQLGIELFQRVHSIKFLFDVELFLAARELGVPVDEVPVCVCYDDFESSVKIAVHSAQTFFGLLSIVARDLRGEYRRPNPAMDPGLIRTYADEVDLGAGGPASIVVPEAQRAAGSKLEG
jgi:hypothetical protein